MAFHNRPACSGGFPAGSAVVYTALFNATRHISNSDTCDVETVSEGHYAIHDVDRELPPTHIHLPRKRKCNERLNGPQPKSRWN